MNLEGRKIIVNKSSEELINLLKNPEDYQQLMPDSLQSFQAREDGFKFSLKGMPEIALKIGDVTQDQVVLNSASSSLDFSLVGKMNPLDDNKTEVQLLFDGKFNPFINYSRRTP